MRATIIIAPLFGITRIVGRFADDDLYALFCQIHDDPRPHKSRRSDSLGGALHVGFGYAGGGCHR